MFTITEKIPCRPSVALKIPAPQKRARQAHCGGVAELMFGLSDIRNTSLKEDIIGG